MHYRATLELVVEPEVTADAVDKLLSAFPDELVVDANWDEHRLTLECEVEYRGSTSREDDLERGGVTVGRELRPVGVIQDWVQAYVTLAVADAGLTPAVQTAFTVMAVTKFRGRAPA